MAAAAAAPRQAVTILAGMTLTDVLSEASVSAAASTLSGGVRSPAGAWPTRRAAPRRGSGLPPPGAGRAPSIGAASGPAAQGRRLLCSPLVQVLPRESWRGRNENTRSKRARGASVSAAGAETGTTLPPQGAREGTADDRLVQGHATSHPGGKHQLESQPDGLGSDGSSPERTAGPGRPGPDLVGAT